MSRLDARLLACVALVILGLTSAQLVHAEDVADRKQRYRFALGSGWLAVDVGEASQTPLIGYQHKRGAVLTVNRVDYPNIPAWRKSTRTPYYDQIERGVRERVTRYKRLKRTALHKGKVPVLDLVFRHRTDAGEHVVIMRFLFYRRYSVSLSVSVPAREYKRRKRALLGLRDSFQPYF